MLRRAGTLLLLLVVLGAGFAWYGRPEEVPPSIRQVDSSTALPIEAKGGADPAESPIAANQPAPRSSAMQKATQSARPHPNANWPVKSGIDEADTYHNVKSPEEARWLNQRWYPTEEELEYANSVGASNELPVDLLPRSARDLAAARIVALDPSRRPDALAALHNAADQGAVYALRAIGEFHEGSGNLLLGHAYFRAALFAGDWQMALRPSFGNAEALVNLQAISIIDGINQRRTLLRLPPLPIVVRPGYLPLLDALATAKP